MTDNQTQRPPSHGDVLTLGFGTTVAMWTAGYITHLPNTPPPPIVLLLIVTAIMLAGGFLLDRLSNRTWHGGAACGALAGGLNLLILGGILTSDQSGRVELVELLYIPTSILAAAICGTIGAFLGQAVRGNRPVPAVNWPVGFTLVTAVAITLLISIGGMVTGYEAGLDVPDWPNSFGYNMFLYPIADMPGGVYFEHSHRLLGSLVGLTTVVLAVYLWRIEQRKTIRTLAIVAVAMVVVQGIMGGLRVTGHFTLSTDRANLAPSILLAMIHGVFGQVYFATLVILASLLTRKWTSDVAPTVRPSVSWDQGVGWVAVVLLIAQLVTGAMVRHIYGGVVLHVALAVIVLLLISVFAVRVWGLYVDVPPLPRLATALIAIASVQLMFGIAALIAIMFEAQGQSSANVQVALTTIHQTFGAILLAMTGTLLLWHYRLLEQTPAA